MPATRRVRSAELDMAIQNPTPSDDPRPTSSGTSTPLFPCSPSPAPKRPSHHKKRPASHIPRPPNAFILFRANFIRDRHLHTTSAGPLSNVSPTALSTIVGITWRNLPEEERQVWVEKARVAREEHKALHPTYRYQPLPTAEERAQHRETKRKVKEENIVRPDLERCQAISRYLVEGYRGQELEDMVASFDRERESSPRPDTAVSKVATPQPVRSSSLPTPVRRRNTRRPRAYSTSGSPPVDRNVPVSRQQSYPYTFDSPYMSSPELRPSTASYDGAMQSIVEPAMPELTYDPSSPSSINLPDLHDGYLTHSPTPDGSTYHPHLPFSPHGTPHSLVSTPPMAVSSTDPFSSPFSSSFSSWDNVQPPAEPYYQFSYFSAINDTTITPETHLSHPSTTINVDPYASPIPPFELYHTLKSFEQSSLHGIPTSPSPTPLYAFHNEYSYDDA